VHEWNASNRDEDCGKMEKEYGVDAVMNILVSKLKYVSVDAFEDSCFVVEDEPGLFEEMGSNNKRMNNGVTLVKLRKTAWPKEVFWAMIWQSVIRGINLKRVFSDALIIIFRPIYLNGVKKWLHT